MARRKATLILGAASLVLLCGAGLISRVGRTAISRPADPGTITTTSTLGYLPSLTLGSTVRKDQLTVGITHTEYSANNGGNPAAIASVLGTLRSFPIQDQALMGWGAGNPEPSPGVYDWTSLESRISLIEQSGATPVITLAGAPDWMKGGAAGTTNWADLNEAPLPAYDGAFAQLAVATARHFPSVTHFLVWNELKGMWDPQAKRWDYERYTALYNTVYDALKAYNPAIQVGGPYVPFDSYLGPQPDPSDIKGAWGILDQRSLDAVTYWLAHKHGADFIAVDAYSFPVDHPAAIPAATANEKLAAISAWLQAQTKLPIWWSEVYPTGPDMGLAAQAAAVAGAILEQAWAGDQEMLLWGPQETGSQCQECLWTDPRQAGGGQSTPLGRAVEELDAILRPGTPLQQVETGTSDVSGLLIGGHLVLVNNVSAPVTLDVEGHHLDLGSFEVLVD